MKSARLYLDDVEYPFITCRYNDFVARIGDFSAVLDGIEVIPGLTTVKIKEDGDTVFQGLVEQPDKQY